MPDFETPNVSAFGLRMIEETLAMRSNRHEKDWDTRFIQIDGVESHEMNFQIEVRGGTHREPTKTDAPKTCSARLRRVQI